MNASAPARPRPPAARPRPPAGRRRVSRRRYMVRRIGVVVVLALVVYGGARLAGTLFGSSDATASSGPGTTVAAATDGSTPTDQTGTDQTGAGPAGTTGASEPAATAAPGDTGAAAPVGTHVPTKDNPAKVLVAGDSDAGTFGPYLDKLLKQTGVASTTLDYKVSSGLSRLDFFDWPTKLRQDLTDIQPDIVVVTFGGNDAQGISDASGTFIANQPTGTDADAKWKELYGQRVGQVMDMLTEGGRPLVWVGIPNSIHEDVTTRMSVQNQVVMDQVAKHPGVTFVDTWKRFSGRNGNYADYVIDPRDNTGKPVRADDGFHLNTTGAEILALDIAEVVKGILVKQGAAL